MRITPAPGRGRPSAAAQLAAACPVTAASHKYRASRSWRDARAAAMTFATSAGCGEVAVRGRVFGSFAGAAGLRSIHSHRMAVANAPDKMAWICRIVAGGHRQATVRHAARSGAVVPGIRRPGARVGRGPGRLAGDYRAAALPDGDESFVGQRRPRLGGLPSRAVLQVRQIAWPMAAARPEGAGPRRWPRGWLSATWPPLAGQRSASRR